MTIFAIATTTHETYGHGSFGEEERILREGHGWKPGKFPPCFTVLDHAQAYIEEHKGDCGERSIVELTLVDGRKKISFRTPCHPQANGRVLVIGDVAEVLTLPLESGQTLRVECGQKAFSDFAALILTRMENEPMGADADKPGSTVTVTHPDTARLSLLEEGNLTVEFYNGAWGVWGKKDKERITGSTLREAIDIYKHIQ